MAILVYQYPACSTCRKALQFLNTHSIKFETRHIVESPPSIGELTQALALLRSEDGDLKNLFNTSGELYREMKVAEKLKSGMKDEEALKLLAAHGKLIKRPLVIGPKWVLVGFREEAWSRRLL
ncbi:MAG TPA: arsenate reductase family protein [Pseudobdellovibrionaceae bacterium]|nr:arsenate reductase family protein [Pseudobdellovibrionaceae bacterium]